MRSVARPVISSGFCVFVTLAAHAATTGFSGAASATVTPVTSGVSGATVRDDLSYPSPDPNLPLQAVARFADPNSNFAGVSGAQFADPATSPSGADTDEFAAQIALASIKPGAGLRGSARAEEVRNVVFSASDLGSPAAGTPVELEGRLLIDGALTIFANRSVSSLSGSSIKLHVVVTREVEGQAAETVYDGMLTVTGGPGLEAQPAASGGFPTFGVFSTDLSAVDASLSAFRVVVFPSLSIPYLFKAVANQPFALRAAVEITAETDGGGAGVAGVLGTPITSLTEVVASTQNANTAAKMTSALESERAKPTGQDAFAAADPFVGPFAFLRACGLFGVESLALLGLLVGLRTGNGGLRRLVR